MLAAEPSHTVCEDGDGPELTEGAVLTVTVTEELVAVQPFASVTVTV
jgi:hypothetical protein